MTLEEIIAGVLNVPASSLTSESSNTSVPEWDSLGHITMMMEIESKYGVSFSAEEAMNLTSVAAIRGALAAKGIQE